MSSYVESILGENEKIIYKAKISLWSLSLLIVFGVILLKIYGLGLILLIIAFIRYKTTELVITDKKLIAKFGFIKRESIELFLQKVESLQVNQSALGRIFGYGSIIVSGVGTSQAPIPGISKPLEFRKQFMAIQEKMKN